MSPPRPVLVGEVLFDRFPDGSCVLGGAPLNVALHLQAFGQAPALVSAVGADALGETLLQRAAAAGLDASNLQVDANHATGTVDITLAGGEPTFTIRPDVAWDHVAWDRVTLPQRVGMLYHGSLALRTVAARTGFARLQTRLDAPVFLDVNLRAPWWSRDAVRELVAGARWVKLNDGELALLADGDEAAAAGELLALGDVELLVVTRGAAGAAAYTRDGACREVVPDAVGLSVVDTVGAGDAFASVLICGLLNGWPLDLTLARAQAFASRIVGCRGAVPTDPDLHATTLTEWEQR